MTSRRVEASLIAATALTLGLAAIAHAEVGQRGDLRVSFAGEIAPRALPRSGTAPVAVTVGGRITTTDGSPPPQLQTISIQINRHGHLDSSGLPICRFKQIQPSTTSAALAACRRSLVGEGSFSADVELPQQAPFPSQGKVLAFNGRVDGRPMILAHVYGTQPVPTSFVLPFAIGRARGQFGTLLTAVLPETTGEWGFVTGISITLHRRFNYHGAPRSYVSAGCPAPAGLPGVLFPLARARFAFAGGRTLTNTLTKVCKVRR